MTGARSRESRVRVLMTADAVGGVWSYALELARALAPRGVEVHLATMGPRPDAAQRAAAAEVPALTLHESDHRLEWMDAPWDDVARAGDWLARLARTLRPDVVHLNGYAHGALPWRAPALVVAHSCVCSWWRAVHGEAAPPSWDRYRAAVRAGLAGAELVAAPTAAMLAALRAEHDVCGEALVLPNGRDARRFRPGRKEPLVLGAGRAWDAAKNLAALDAAAAELPWPVRVAGPVVHPDGGEQPFRHVDALGPLAHDALAAELARAAIFALPARYEPFGLAALEAGLAGCALVLGDIPSLRELWQDAAVFVPPDDVDGLRAALVALACDPDRRSALAGAARARALTFTPHRMTDAYLEAYRRLPRRSRAAASAAPIMGPPSARPTEAIACTS